jgi:hypothetical protein
MDGVQYIGDSYWTRDCSMREIISNVDGGLCLHCRAIAAETGSCREPGKGPMSWRKRERRGVAVRGVTDAMACHPSQAAENNRQSLNSLYFRRVCLKGAERNA